MKIESVWIKNWRSVREEKLQAQDLMVIIGQNNHGKSNLLSSVLFFFGEIKPQDLDFYNESPELFVEIKFGDLDESDKTTFKKYLTSEEKIVVRKSACLGGSFEYKGYIENPSEDWLQEANAFAYMKRDLTGKAMLDEGRVYGGGMHKMEPKELMNVPAIEIQALFNDSLPELQPDIFANEH